MSDRILLENMSFEGRHGWPDEERREPQTIEVDLEIGLDLRRAAADDDLALTVDYGRAYETTRSIVEERSFRLLEALAEAIARAILTDYPIVAEVLVRIRKPRVAIGRQLDTAAVEIKRSRTGP